MIRWLILVLGFYAGLVFLPSMPGVMSLLEAVEAVPTGLATAISFGAAALSALLAYALALRPNAPVRSPFPWWVSLIGAALFGACISGLFDLFEFLSGQAVSLVNLIIIPTAFVIGEGLYQVLSRIWRLMRPKPDLAEFQDATDLDPAAGEQAQPSRVLRLAIVLPVYAFIVVVLPQQADMQRWLRQFDFVHPTVMFWISVGAILAGLVGAVIIGLVWPESEDGASAPIYEDVLERTMLGLIFGGGINVLGALFGLGAARMEYLITIPIAFAAAELVYRAIYWRLNRQFD